MMEIERTENAKPGRVVINHALCEINQQNTGIFCAGEAVPFAIVFHNFFLRGPHYLSFLTILVYTFANKTYTVLNSKEN